MSVGPRILILLTLLAAAQARAQEPAPARLGWGMLQEGDAVQLTLPWRFHPGDDPSWREPRFDDRGWVTADPQMPEGGRPRGGWTGVGWFRRHVVFDSTLRGRALALSVDAPGRAEVWLDGRLVLSSGGAGTLPAGTAGERPRAGAFGSVEFGGSAEHVIAVRYECDCAAVPGRIGFLLSLERQGALQSRAAALRRTAMLYGWFMAIPAVLAALHLGLFTFYPKSRENLFCALCLLSFSVIVASEFADDIGGEGALVRVLAAASMPAVLSAIFFGLVTYFALRAEKLPRSWLVFAIAGVAIALLVPLLSELGQNIAWTVYFAASIVEILRFERSGRKADRPSAGPMLVGMLILDAAVVIQVLFNFGVLSPPWGFNEVYLVGVLAFSISASLFIARSFARTSVSLERRLAEVETLTAQVIATERESERKSVEIEAARTLQRSILPARLPRVPGLEVAATITTASEVGGDYYDFREVGEDTLVVAVGDAAGHGVAAGAMVIATKALVSSLAGEESLAATLVQCDRVLRGMNVRPLHMCLLLARITPREITVASAAMPRVLRYRAGGEVDEIPAGGVPLASGLTGTWNEETVPLAPGDVLLFASDGLAEALSPDGDPLGYDRVAAIFREVAPSGGASSIAEQLMQHARSWRGTREQDDDVAIVVVRVV